MKKLITSTLGLGLACALALGLTFGLTSCDGGDRYDDYEGMRAVSGIITNLPNDTAEYELEMYPHANISVTLAGATISPDGRFYLTLPSTVKSSLMSPYIDVFGDDLENWAYVSDPYVRVSDVSIAVYRNSIQIGHLEYGKYYNTQTSSDETFGKLFYADGYCNVTGQGEGYYGYATYAIFARRGWNWVFRRYIDNPQTEQESFNTSVPGGLSWFIEDVSKKRR